MHHFAISNAPIPRVPLRSTLGYRNPPLRGYRPLRNTIRGFSEKYAASATPLNDNIGASVVARLDWRSVMSFHGILVHVIFSTQYRKRLLADKWRDDLFAIIGDQVKEHKGVLLQAGGIEDHVHLLLKMHPSFAIADTIRHLKANSSHWINATERMPGKFHWQKGYAAFSVSQSVAERVGKYIINQVKHHQTKTFQEEYLEFLDRHNIIYDRAHVFDEEILS